jgi:hypothetical protein
MTLCRPVRLRGEANDGAGRSSGRSAASPASAGSLFGAGVGSIGAIDKRGRR